MNTSSHMASFFSTKRYKHDVFLSFRGEDTRDNFTSHLHHALTRKHIKTFIDNELSRGEEINEAILKTIEESKVAVIVLSRDFASSRWCLDEVEKMMECHEKMGQIVIPVFYHVNPLHVAEPTFGVFKEAFNRHEHDFKDNLDKVERWKFALVKASQLVGWDSQVIRPESTLVKEIVMDILKRLKQLSSEVLESLVGVYSRIEEIKERLSLNLLDVRILGIWGMGGIGKTMIAESVYNQIAGQFEGCCFLSNVRERSQNCGGLVCLGEELLSKTLEVRDIKLDTPSLGHSFYVRNMLRHKKVLVVLDDVDSPKELEFLAGNRCWFGLGSRIIVTGRDKQVLQLIVDGVYEVEGLVESDALELFCLNAFKQKYPMKDYLVLSNNVIKYAKGNPLALKVLGSFLCTKNISEWENYLDKLLKVPNKDVQNVLRTSYDGLDNEEKEIFLHLACFFKGEYIGRVMHVLDGCGFSSKIGIRSLIDKSLITIVNGEIRIHDLLQEMGKEIVRQESKEPGKRSRLWNHEDVRLVLTKNKGTDVIEGIFLDMFKSGKLDLNPDVFVGMSNLKLLKFYESCANKGFKQDGMVHLSQGLEFLSSELRYLHWYKYPLTALPANFQPLNLVELHLPYSKVKRLWNGAKDLVSLKEFNLRGCKHLIEIPDLSEAPNLTTMALSDCTHLRKVPATVSHLRKLSYISLLNCKNIKKFPSTLELKFLDTLFLCCPKIKRFPVISRNIRYLYLSGTAIKEVPSSIENLTRLVKLDMEYCTKLKSFPRSICKLKCLEELNLSNCTSLRYFPEILETMDHLKTLRLDGTAIVELPSSIENLKWLTYLNLQDCKNLAHIPESFGNLGNLRYAYLSDCPKLAYLPNNLRNLTSLDELCVSGCNLWSLPSNLNFLSSISELYLIENNFESLRADIKQLSQLRILDLSFCTSLKSLPELPLSLGVVGAHDCISLESIHGLKKLYQLEQFDSLGCGNMIFTNCFSLDENEWGDFLVDAQLFIWHLAAQSEDSKQMPYVSICFPGSDIPTWFTHKSDGNSVTVQLPPFDQNNSLLGFALCFVLEFHNEYHDGDFCIQCDCYVDNSYGDCSYLNYTLTFSSNYSSKPMYIDSEHVVLYYNTSLSAALVKEHDCETECSYTFEFFPEFENGTFESFEVKVCAVLPLFADSESCSQLEMRAQVETKESNKYKRGRDVYILQEDEDELGGRFREDEGEPHCKKLKQIKGVPERL